MTKHEYLMAVKQAKWIFAYIRITDRRPSPTKISKAKARDIVSQVKESDKIRASWADNDNLFLLVG